MPLKHLVLFWGTVVLVLIPLKVRNCCHSTEQRVNRRLIVGCAVTWIARRYRDKHNKEAQALEEPAYDPLLRLPKIVKKFKGD